MNEYKAIQGQQQFQIQIRVENVEHVGGHLRTKEILCVSDYLVIF